MRVQWNTGNKYTVHGQRIVAELRGDVVLFRDIDRMIYGVITAPLILELFAPADLRSYVWAAYNANAYQWHGDAGSLKWEG